MCLCERGGGGGGGSGSSSSSEPGATTYASQDERERESAGCVVVVVVVAASTLTQRAARICTQTVPARHQTTASASLGTRPPWRWRAPRAGGRSGRVRGGLGVTRGCEAVRLLPCRTRRMGQAGTYLVNMGEGGAGVCPASSSAQVFMRADHGRPHTALASTFFASHGDGHVTQHNSL